MAENIILHTGQHRERRNYMNNGVNVDLITLNKDIYVRNTCAGNIIYNYRIGGNTFTCNENLLTVLEYCSLTQKYQDVVKKYPEEVIKKLLDLKILVKTEDVVDNSTRIKKVSDLTMPVWLTYRITNFCPLECKHCIYSSGSSLSHELSYTDIAAMIKKLSKTVVHLVISGGEPLTRKDLYKVLEYGWNQGMSQSVITSGYTANFDPHALSTYLDAIQFSVDGLEKMHDWLRKKGSFSKVVDKIQKIAGKSPTVFIATCLWKGNIKDLPGLLELLEALSVDIWKLQPLLPLGKTKKEKALCHSPEDMVALYAAAEQIINDLNPDIKVDLSLPFMESSGKDEHTQTEGSMLICGRGGNPGGYIDPEGNFYLCELQPESFLGNLKSVQYNLDELYTKRNTIAFPQRIGDVTACANCEYVNICKTGCRALAAAYHNNAYAKDPVACLFRGAK